MYDVKAYHGFQTALNRDARTTRLDSLTSPIKYQQLHPKPDLTLGSYSHCTNLTCQRDEPWIWEGISGPGNDWLSCSRWIHSRTVPTLCILIFESGAWVCWPLPSYWYSWVAKYLILSYPSSAQKARALHIREFCMSAYIASLCRVRNFYYIRIRMTKPHHSLFDLAHILTSFTPLHSPLHSEHPNIILLSTQALARTRWWTPSGYPWHSWRRIPRSLLDNALAMWKRADIVSFL